MPKKLKHPIAGPLTYTEYDWWEGTMEFPEFDDFKIKFDFDINGIPEAIDDDDADDRDPIELTIPVDNVSSPSPAQEAALRRLFEQRSTLVDEILIGLVKTFRSYMAGMMFGYPEAKIDASRKAVAKFNLESAERMKDMVEPLSVSVLQNEKNGEAYVTIDFNCAWDFEHGTSLLMHMGKFIVGSVGADFGGREDLGGHVEHLLAD